MPQLNLSESIFYGWRRVLSLWPLQSMDRPEERKQTIMRSDVSGARWCFTQPQRVCLLLWRLTTSLLKAAGMSSVHHWAGATFSSHSVIVRESSWALISLTVRGKWKCVQLSVPLDLLGPQLAIPRAFLTISRPAPTGNKGNEITHLLLRLGWRGTGLVAAMLGTSWPGIYFAHVLAWTSLPEHSKTWNLTEICGFELQLGPLRENTT